MLIKGYTDFGTEVEYLYNPKSGEVRRKAEACFPFHAIVF